jgi:hypothetical protein
MRTLPGLPLDPGQGAVITNKFREINIRGAEQAATFAGQTGPKQGIVRHGLGLTIDGLIYKQPWTAKHAPIPLRDRTNSAAFAALLAIPDTILLDNVLYVDHDTI